MAADRRNLIRVMPAQGKVELSRAEQRGGRPRGDRRRSGRDRARRSPGALAQRGLRTWCSRRSEPGARRDAAWRPACWRRSPRPTSARRTLIALNLAGAAALAGLRRRSSRRDAASDCGYRAIGHADRGGRPRRGRGAAADARPTSARWGSTPSGSPARECRRLEPGLAPRVAGGILAPHDHQVVAARRWRARWRRALAAAGGELRRGSARACGLAPRPEGVEAVRAGAAASRLAARCRRASPPARSRARLEGCRRHARVPVRPVKGQILRLRARAPVRRCPRARVIRTPEVYAVPRDDGRLVVGATVEERGFDRSVTAGGVLELLRRAYEALPGIAELELVEARRRACGPRHARQRADRRRERGPRASCGRPATGATGSCSRRSPPRRSPRCSPARSRRRSSPRSRRGASPTAPPRRWRDEDRRERRRARGAGPDHGGRARARASDGGPRDGRGVAVAVEAAGRAAQRLGRRSSCRRASASRCSERSRGDDGGDAARLGDRRPPLELAPDHRHRRLPQPRRDGARDRRSPAPRS